MAEEIKRGLPRAYSWIGVYMAVRKGPWWKPWARMMVDHRSFSGIVVSRETVEEIKAKIVMDPSVVQAIKDGLNPLLLEVAPMSDEAVVNIMRAGALQGLHMELLEG